MCTIGSVLDGKGMHTFKQCDLPCSTHFFQPEIRSGSAGRYLAFARDGRPGIWAGINERGVAFVAADAYTEEKFTVADDRVNDLFRIYEETLACSRTAAEATNFLRKSYQNGCPTPDILQWSDAQESLCTEFSPPDNFQSEMMHGGFFVSTNHFHVLPGAIREERNPSTYVRLRRARMLLNEHPSKEGIFALLEDQENGASQRSICRIAEKEGEYFTQASVVFSVGDGRVQAAYVLNGNPRNKQFSTIVLVPRR